MFSRELESRLSLSGANIIFSMELNIELELMNMGVWMKKSGKTKYEGMRFCSGTTVLYLLPILLVSALMVAFVSPAGATPAPVPTTPILFGIPVTQSPYTTGSLAITSTPPGADMYIDGSYRGITPATVSGQLIGPHTIKLRKTGYNDYVTTAMVYGGQSNTGETTRVNGTLLPLDQIPANGSEGMSGIADRIAERETGLRTFRSHIDEKSALGINTSAAEAKYAEAEQTIKNARNLSATRNTEAYSSLDEAGQSIRDGETALDRAWAENEVARAQVPINNVDTIIQWFNAGTGTSEDTELAEIGAKREAAARNLSAARDEIGTGNYAQARIRAQDAFNQGNESYTEALARQQQLVSAGSGSPSQIPAGIFVLFGVLAVILVAGLYMLYTRRTGSENETPPSPPAPPGHDGKAEAPQMSQPSAPPEGVVKPDETKNPIPGDDPVRILKLRYARGEITTEEYLRMMENLRK